MSLAPRPLRLLLATALIGALAASPAPAATTTPRVLPTIQDTLSVTGAKRLTCSARPRTGGSVDSTVWRAPDDGLLKVRLDGGSRGDWDLALFDAATGRKLAASSAFRSNELASAYVVRGQAVDVQACLRRGSRRSVPLAIDFAAFKPAPLDHRIQLVEVDVPTAWDKARLASLGVDLSDHSDGHTQHAVLYSPADAMKLTGAGFRYRVEIPDVLAQDARDRAAERRFALSGRRADIPSGRTSYRQYDDFLADLKAMVDDHPGVVRPITLPVKSLDGRDIVGVEIATDVDRTDDGRPVFVQIGTHHAREWPAAEATIEFGLDLLARGLAGEPRWKDILDNARTYIIPIQNPDGFVTTRTFPNSPNDDNPTFPFTPQQGSGAAGYRRKNCRPLLPDEDGVPCELRQQGDNGVDTNRNYGEQWGGPGTSSDQSSLVYHGEGPFSEPESESVRELLVKVQPTVLITNHTFSGLILRPPGTADNGPAPDEDRMRLLGDAMARETEYTSQYSYQLYDTTGTTDDWLYGGLSSFSFTPEIGKTNFHPSYTDDFIPEYDGKDSVDKNGDEIKLGGLREAYVLAGLAAINPDTHSILRGTAPAGRTLRIKRDFVTVTSARPDDDGVQHPVQRLPEHRESTLTVPSSGEFVWHVDPSTRPFEPEPVPWTLTCEDGAGNVLEQRDVFVARGQQLTLDLACAPAQPDTPTPAPVPVPPQTPPVCADTFSPQSTFAKGPSRVGRRGLSLRGGSTDRGCTDPGTSFLRASGVGKVQVSIARVVRGNRCRFLGTRGFGKVRSCRSQQVYLDATGTTSWRLERKLRLPKGEYKLWVRGVDQAQNVERRDARRNFWRVFVR
jgi:murein tripeptide amidase MpaA